MHKSGKAKILATKAEEPGERQAAIGRRVK